LGAQKRERKILNNTKREENNRERLLSYAKKLLWRRLIWHDERNRVGEGARFVKDCPLIKKRGVAGGRGRLV